MTTGRRVPHGNRGGGTGGRSSETLLAAAWFTAAVAVAAAVRCAGVGAVVFGRLGVEAEMIRWPTVTTAHEKRAEKEAKKDERVVGFCAMVVSTCGVWCPGVSEM